jgi:hypothetical protein
MHQKCRRRQDWPKAEIGGWFKPAFGWAVMSPRPDNHRSAIEI